MDFLRGPPLVGIDDADRAIGSGDAGVVDEQRDRAELFRGSFDDAFDVAAFRHVACDSKRAASGRFDFARDLIELGFVARGESDSGAFGGEAQGDAFANAAARAGDQGDLSCERSTHFVRAFRDERRYRRKGTAARDSVLESEMTFTGRPYRKRTADKPGHRKALCAGGLMSEPKLRRPNERQACSAAATRGAARLRAGFIIRSARADTRERAATE